MTPPEPRSSPRLAQVAFGLLLAARIAFDIAVPPIGDEAYYWMWGQKLSWSYLDHPPLHAWLLHLVATLAGWNLFSLRALTWLTLGGTLWLIWLLSRRLAPDSPKAWFWPSAAICLASPLFFTMSAISFHDHLLIFLCLLAAFLILRFTETWEETGRGFAWLYAFGAILGLAVLTKYNGILFGLGVTVFLVVHKPLRPLWRSPHLYAAAILAIVIQAPVLWWNLSNSLASYRFHLSERWGDGIGLQPLGPLRFAVIAVLFVSPFLVPAIIGLIRTRDEDPFADRARVLAVSVFATSSLAMLALSAFVEVYFYWNIVAAVALMPLVVGRIGRVAFRLHLAYGVVIAVLAIVNYGVIPLASLTGNSDWYAASNFGWPNTAARIAVLEQTHPVGFVATTRYSTAAQLGFALHDSGVVPLADRHTQYDYWFDPASHEGQDALIVSDPQVGTREAAAHFDTLTPLETLNVTRFGVTIYESIVYLGRNFHAVPVR